MTELRAFVRSWELAFPRSNAMLRMALQGLCAAEARNHPTFVWMKEVSVGCADVNARRGKRSAAQDFLADEPFIVVFVEFRLEARVRRVIRSCPFPRVTHHLMAAITALA